MKKMRGIITIEASYIMPLILMVIIMILNMVFYFHDKNIVRGAAWETAVIMAQQNKFGDQSLTAEDCFKERLGSKLVLFDSAGVEMKTEEKSIIITAKAHHGYLNISAETKASVTFPEDYIRNIRKADQIIQEIKK